MAKHTTRAGWSVKRGTMPVAYGVFEALKAADTPLTFDEVCERAKEYIGYRPGIKIIYNITGTLINCGVLNVKKGEIDGDKRFSVVWLDDKYKD